MKPLFKFHNLFIFSIFFSKKSTKYLISNKKQIFLQFFLPSLEKNKKNQIILKIFKKNEKNMKKTAHFHKIPGFP